jgi:hypothetical protein
LRLGFLYSASLAARCERRILSVLSTHAATTRKQGVMSFIRIILLFVRLHDRGLSSDRGPPGQHSVVYSVLSNGCVSAAATGVAPIDRPVGV